MSDLASGVKPERIFHVVPDKDGFDHADSPYCMCGPMLSFKFPGADEQLPEGSMLCIHYGLDGSNFKYLSA